MLEIRESNLNRVKQEKKANRLKIQISGKEKKRKNLKKTLKKKIKKRV